MKVTIKDIAEKANVSITSVSLILNEKPSRIPEETKKRVLRAADDLGYKPIKRKETERKKNTDTIGLILPDIYGALIPQLSNGVETYASLYGYKVISCNAGDSSEQCLEYIYLLSELKVNGIILVPPLDMNKDGNNKRLGEALRMIKIPFLLLDRAINHVFCDFITTDNKSGAHIAIEHLIMNGHKDIGVIAGIDGVYNTRKRLDGCKEAMAYYSLHLKEEMIFYADYKREQAYIGAEYFWKKGISAIFAMNDEMAMGVYDFAEDNALKIGEDISVVGFDDMKLCDKLNPPLTTVYQSGEVMGKKACEVILRRISGDEEENRNNYFAPQLIERASVKNLLA